MELPYLALLILSCLLTNPNLLHVLATVNCLLLREPIRPCLMRQCLSYELP